MRDTNQASESNVVAVAPRRSVQALLCVILIGVTLLTYHESLEHDFVTMDDYPYVVENTKLHQGLTRETFVWAMRTFHESSWIPLTWLSLALDVEISGLDPRGFHRTNLAFHAANVVLLYLALAALSGSHWRSLLTAAVFALHPIHVESVAWVTERKDVLSGFFFMSTLWCWACYARDATGWRYLWVAGCTGLGLLAKSSLVTLPFVLLLLDFWPLQRLRDCSSGGAVSTRLMLRAVVEKVPLFFLALGATVATYWAGVSGNALETTAKLSAIDRIANAAIAYVLYLRDSIWPIHLSAFYPHPGSEISLAGAAGAGALLVGITWFAVSRIRTHPQLIVGWCWFLGSLLPMIGLVQAGAQARADRFMYLPQIGLCIALFWSIPSYWLSNRFTRTGLASLAILWLVALSLGTQTQLEYWRNGITLFEHTRAVTRDNAFVRHSLGQAYLRAGRLEDATHEFRAAVDLAPGWLAPMAAMGEVMAENEKPERAVRWFERVLERRQDWVEVRRALAELLVERGQHERAIPHLQKLAAAKEYADDAEIHGALGLAFALTHAPDAAAMHYRAALALRPAYPAVHANLGLLLAEQGSFDAALSHLSRAVRLGSDDAEVHFARAKLLLAAGDERLALAALHSAVKARPNWLAAVNNLAWHLVVASEAKLRDPALAMSLARRAARLSSRSNPTVLETLAVALEANRRSQEAIAVLDEARELAHANGDTALAARLAEQRLKWLVELESP